MPASHSESRHEILQRIRSHATAAETLPDILQDGIHYPDPIARFCEVLALVGGRGVHVPTLNEAQQVLNQTEHYQTARKRVSACPGIGETNFPVELITDPHDFDDVDFAVLPGRLAVAENAAVWVTGNDAPHRVLYFLTQHLSLVVPSQAIVHNLGQAYPRVNVNEAPFTAWISGPSKTADIEQSLVIGAHGPRSLIVFLVDELNVTP